MASKKLGEIKGPFIVWLFVTLYFAIGMVFSGSTNGTLPQNLTMPVVLNLLVAMARGWGVILAFLFIFLALWEKRRRLRDIFSSVGLKREGSVKSVFWSFALFPMFIVIGLTAMMLSYFLGSLPTPVSSNGQTPLWYLWYMIIYSFFPVAVVEEAIGRGYMLDRLIPQHPSSLTKALPAILLGSLLFTLWHVPSYLMLYPLSATWVVGLSRQCFPSISSSKHSLRSSKNQKHYWSCAYPFSAGQHANYSFASLTGLACCGACMPWCICVLLFKSNS